MIDFQNPVTAGTVLVRSAIQSPNYSAGSAGWTINIDGSAEFNNLTIRGVFNGADYVLNSSGAFFYNGTPGAQNLIASIASVAGVDAFGNIYGPGVMTYRLVGGVGQVSYMEMVDDNLLIGGVNAGAFVAGPASFGSSNGHYAFVYSGLNSDVTETVQGGLNLFAGIPAAVTGGAKVPHVNVVDDSGLSPVDLRVSGSVVAADLSGTPLTWQAPAYNANWAGGTAFNASTGLQTLQYRKDPLNNLIIDGAFAAGAVLPGATIFNVAAAYRPLKNKWFHAVRNNGGAITHFDIQLTTGGNVNIVATMGGGIAVSNEYYVDGAVIPLGNIP